MDPRFGKPMKIEPVTLEGNIVRLEPLSVNHAPSLAKVGLDENLKEQTYPLLSSTWHRVKQSVVHAT
jgi:hypothetical protein